MVCFNGLTQCVFNPLWNNTYIVAPEFKHYLHRFSKDYTRFTNKELDTRRITIMFSRSVEALAVCEKEYLPNSGRIRVNKDKWFETNEIQREFIIYHELGHCALNIIDHNWQMEQMRPKSMMYPNIISSEVYTMYREDYLRQLFLNDMNGELTLGAFSRKGEVRGLMKIENLD
jgi:hypothetical protein